MIEPEYITEETKRMARQTYDDVKDSMHRHLGSSLLGTLLTGFTMGLLLGIVWTESRRKYRAQRLLDDIENGFKELTRPPLRRAGTIATDGLQTLNRGLRNGEARLEQTIRNVRRRISSFFS